MAPCEAMNITKNHPVARLSRLGLVIAVMLVLAWAISFGLVDASTPAQGQPPHVFTGSASIDGNPAPEGTVVSVIVNGTTVVSVQVDADGKYPPLVVTTSGVTVGFEVDGHPADQTATTEVGGASILHLTARTTSQGLSTPTPMPPAPTATVAPLPATVAPPPTSTPRPPEPTPTPTNTPIPPVFESPQAAFRVGPTVRLRPVNDVIDRDMDGLVEVLFRNPVLNDAIMVVDLTVSLPSGFHLYGEGFATDVAAGAASGSFDVPPGQSRTIFLNIKAEKTGRTLMHFNGTYWPKGNKDLFNPVSLTHPFVVNEPSPDPFGETPTNQNQIPGSQSPDGAPQPAPTAVATPAQESDPSVSCSLSPQASGDNTATDTALLALPLLGLAGLTVFKRRPDDE